jgi:uncharacterized protein (TIGR03435 family)
MLQDLIAERFHLKVHHETRELPAYNLVVVKSGLRMHLSESAKQVIDPAATQMDVT